MGNTLDNQNRCIQTGLKQQISQIKQSNNNYKQIFQYQNRKIHTANYKNSSQGKKIIRINRKQKHQQDESDNPKRIKVLSNKIPKSEENQNHLKQKILAPTYNSQPKNRIPQLKKSQSQSQNQLKKNTQKAYTLFNSLNLLKNYTNSYKKQFPILVLNKSKQVIQLRVQIKNQKRYHSYFYDSLLQQSNNRNINIMRQEYQDYIQNHYRHYLLLENVQKIIVTICQTGRHQKVLHYLLKIDQQISLDTLQQTVQINQKGREIAYHQLQMFIKQFNSIKIQFIDMLYFQIEKQLNQQKINSNSHRINTIRQESILDVKQLIIKQNDYLLQTSKYKKNRKNNSNFQSILSNSALDKSFYQQCKQIGLQIYSQNKVCFYIVDNRSDQLFWINGSFNRPQFNGKQFNSTNQIPNCKQLLTLMQFHAQNQVFRINMLFMLLQRYQAFAEILQVEYLHINVFVKTSSKQIINQFIDQNQNQNNRWKNLNILLINQAQLPCVDIGGNLILQINSSNQVKFKKQSVGSGDIWDFIKNSKSNGLEYLLQEGFEYIQIIGTNNSLQYCFDCFMLGITDKKMLDWSTKGVQSCMKQLPQLKLKQEYKLRIQNYSHNQILIYENEMNQIQMINPLQQKYLKIVHQLKQKKQSSINKHQQLLAYTNHSIFSVNYIKKQLESNKWNQKLTYRKNIIRNQKGLQFITYKRQIYDMFKNIQQTQVTHLKQIQDQNLNNKNHQEEQQFKRIINLAQCMQNPNKRQHKKYLILKYQRQNQYYPLLYDQNDGLFDIKGCAKAISKRFLQYLNISVQKYILNKDINLSTFKDTYMIESCKKSNIWDKSNADNQNRKQNKFLKCYIDPYVSLQGQGLDEIKLQIQKRFNQVLTSAYNQFQANQDYGESINYQDSYYKAQFQTDIQMINKRRRLLSQINQIYITRRSINKKKKQQQNQAQQKEQIGKDQNIRIMENDVNKQNQQLIRQSQDLMGQNQEQIREQEMLQFQQQSQQKQDDDEEEQQYQTVILIN